MEYADVALGDIDEAAKGLTLRLRVRFDVPTLRAMRYALRAGDAGQVAVAVSFALGCDVSGIDVALADVPALTRARLFAWTVRGALALRPAWFDVIDSVAYGDAARVGEVLQ